MRKCAVKKIKQAVKESEAVMANLLCTTINSWSFRKRFIAAIKIIIGRF
jgi:hypothetical protein